ncbi:MAG: DNA polymerase Y family protein [Gammaproteobacteria bacterium]|nr:DNA polymerase Y family protein [Gammaproteobacteria bacterium]
MLWLCLRFPQLPLELFTVQKAATGPAVVVDNQRLLVCNRAAINAGAVPGITPATAHALCGQITILERDPQREAETLQRIAYSCYGFTPAINTHAPDWLLLEIGSSLKLFGGIKALLIKFKQHLADQHFSYRFGLAPTPKAAQLLSQLPAQQKLELVSCFDALTGNLQQPEQFTALLDALPLPQLLCEPKLKKQFQASGFTTLRDLLPLPHAALGRRFGKAFLTYLQQITGELADPQPRLTLPPEFDDTLALSDAIASAEILIFPMKRMLIALCGYLQGRQLHCQQITWHLRLTNNSHQKIELALSRPQNRLDHFLALTRLRLENLRFAAPVDTLRLQVPRLHLAIPQEEDLFGNSPDSPLGSKQATSDLLDRLTTRLGSGAVNTLALADSHIPEQAWQPTTDGSITDGSIKEDSLPPTPPLSLIHI